MGTDAASSTMPCWRTWASRCTPLARVEDPTASSACSSRSLRRWFQPSTPHLPREVPEERATWGRTCSMILYSGLPFLQVTVVVTCKLGLGELPLSTVPFFSDNCLGV